MQYQTIQEVGQMEKISIIVPVYNSEKSVEKTLTSLLNQTYEHIEIICVNDGSTDRSPALLNKITSQHKSIKTIHQKNQGVSVARNTGINNASGDIIMFVDADDELLPNACNRIASIFSQTNAEVVTFGFLCKPTSAMPLGIESELKPPSKVYDTFASTLLFEDKARPYTCRSAVSKKLLTREKIEFEPHIKLGEDQIIYFLLYPLSKKTVLIPDQLYIYNMETESATHKNADSENGQKIKLNQHMLVIETIMREWTNRNLKHSCISELQEWMLDFVLFDINSLPRQDKQKYFRRLMDDFTSYFGPNPHMYTQSREAKRCLKKISRALEINEASTTYRPHVTIIDIALFYRRRYGTKRCFQQLLIGLGILKKWR